MTARTAGAEAGACGRRVQAHTTKRRMLGRPLMAPWRDRIWCTLYGPLDRHLFAAGGNCLGACEYWSVEQGLLSMR